MVQKTELRIGNLVEATCGIGKVLEITAEGIVIEGEGFTDIFSEMYVKPILLTEEWLLKFGFEKDKYDAFLYPNCNYIMRTVQFGNPYQLNGINDMGWNFEFSDNNDWVDLNRLQYVVHQLQNLFFAISGEELKLPS